MLLIKEFEDLKFRENMFEDAKESKSYMVYINLRTNEVWTEQRNYVNTYLMFPAYIIPLHQGTGYKSSAGYDHITKEKLYSKYITKETELLELMKDFSDENKQYEQKAQLKLIQL